MSFRKGRLMSAVIASALAASAGLAWAADASQPSLADQVRQLQAEVQQLKAQQQATTAAQASTSAAPTSAADAAATAAALQRDADQPAGLLAVTNPMLSGYDNGFVLQDPVGNFVFHPSLILQARNVTDYAEDGKSVTNKNGRVHFDSGTENGWEIRWAEFMLSGNLFTPNLTYKFQIADQSTTNAVTLYDAFMAYKFMDTQDVGQLTLKIGQFKDPVDHEEFGVGDEKQLAADRSLVNDILGGGAIGPWTQGADLMWASSTGMIRTQTVLHDGGGNSVGGSAQTPAGGSLNSNFRDPTGQFAPIWGVAQRVEYKVFGNWSEYDDFTAHRERKDLLVIGAGGDATQQNNANVYHMTVDAQYKTCGKLAIYGALLGDFTDFRNIAHRNNNFDWGALVQASYCLTGNWEPFVRADAIFLDHDLAGAGNNTDITEWTAGVNYYLGQDGNWGHHAKITLDGTYLPRGAGPVDRLAEDELSAREKEQFLLQVQFQLWL